MTTPTIDLYPDAKSVREYLVMYTRDYPDIADIAIPMRFVRCDDSEIEPIAWTAEELVAWGSK